MVMYGADVQGLRQLAQQFEHKAAQLDQDRMTVGNAIQVSAWVGPVAVRFRHEWESSHSRAVHNAAGRLRDAAAALRRNADEQEKTSSVGSSAGGGGGVAGGGSAPGGKLPDLWALPQEMRHQLQSLIDAIRGGEVGGIKPWEAIGLLGKIAQLGGVDMSFLNTLSTGFQRVSVLNKLLDGDPSALFGLTHQAGDLIGRINNPVAKLGSLALHMGAFAGEEASKADFSAETRARVGNYIVNNPTALVEVVGESALKVGKEVVGYVGTPLMKIGAKVAGWLF